LRLKVSGSGKVRKRFGKILYIAIIGFDGTKTIEILGATLEEAGLEKGIFFSTDLHPILCS
jgi:hypothetical protein